MEEVEGTIYDGDTAIVSGVTVLLDFGDAPGQSPDSSGWHAHVALPLSTIVEPGEQMWIEITDGRSGPVQTFTRPTIEGDRALYQFVGIGPLREAGA